MRRCISVISFPRVNEGFFNMTASFRCGCCLLTLIALAGCGKGTVDFQAQVTLDGKPLSGAAVTLIGTGDVRNRPATGISDEKGMVRFTTFQSEDGALPGEYKVLVSKMPGSLEEEF